MKTRQEKRKDKKDTNERKETRSERTARIKKTREKVQLWATERRLARTPLLVAQEVLVEDMNSIVEPVDLIYSLIERRNRLLQEAHDIDVAIKVLRSHRP